MASSHVGTNPHTKIEIIRACTRQETENCFLMNATLDIAQQYQIPSSSAKTSHWKRLSCTSKFNFVRSPAMALRPMA